MKNNRQQQTKHGYRIFSYAKSHPASLGLFLAAYGAFYLTAVLLSGWTISDWGKDITGIPPLAINTLLPRSFFNPIFFVTSFPTLIIGVAMLCVYSLRGINSEAAVNKKHIAILLTAFGFMYQVIGAWPLGQQNSFPWQWQKQIISYGSIFSWMLYILSLVVLMIGVISLYKHSLIYHQNHPDG
jgi:hypothetical protein